MENTGTIYWWNNTCKCKFCTYKRFIFLKLGDICKCFKHRRVDEMWLGLLYYVCINISSRHKINSTFIHLETQHSKKLFVWITNSIHVHHKPVLLQGSFFEDHTLLLWGNDGFSAKKKGMVGPSGLKLWLLNFLRCKLC